MPINWNGPIRRKQDWIVGRLVAILNTKVVVAFPVSCAPSPEGDFYCVYEINGRTHNPLGDGYELENYTPQEHENG